jgi:FKBP12-rapamycin complex-associated protein
VEKLSGVAVIDALLAVEYEENVNKLAHFNTLLRIALQCADAAVLSAASRALGHLARCGGVQCSDNVETDVKRALEWLSAAGATDNRKLAATLILKELAQNAPVVFYISVPAFVGSVWVALRDKSPQVRAEAHAALDACLTICEQRESSAKERWYRALYDEADRELRAGQPDGVHGAVLVYDALLRHARDFARPHFADICKNVLQNKDSKSITVRRCVVSLLPQLAKFDPKAFVFHHLNTCMTHLLALINKVPAERSAPYLELLVAAIKANLSPKAKGGVCTEALACTAMLTAAMSTPVMANHVQSILPLMFATGLSQQLVNAL